MESESAVEGNDLEEGIDYYLEDDRLVFTSAFLRRRGYCCESGCRHCPWDYRADERRDGLQSFEIPAPARGTDQQ